MPENPKNPNPFQPAQPKIPGVPGSPEQQSASPEAEKRTRAKSSPSTNKTLFLAAGGGAAVMLLIIVVFWMARGATRHIRQMQDQRKSAPAMDSSTRVAQTLPVGPGKVATTEEMAKTWSAKEFLYRMPSGDTVPAMVVHLPGNEYWAFSLRAPYGSCDLEYVTDPGKLFQEYDFSSHHPMVGDPCSHTVYDLTQYGAGPNGLVRGAVVAGSAVRPPLAIEVQINGDGIFATRAESQ